MASIDFEKASKPAQTLHINTYEPSGTAYSEKSPAVSTEIPRESGVSTPASVHQGNPFDTDLEAMVPTTSADTLNRKSTSQRPDPNCTVWPGRDHWKQKAKAAKMQRSCTCMAHLSKRTRLIVKILIALLIIGIAVGVGVGISKPLGAGIWHQ